MEGDVERGLGEEKRRRERDGGEETWREGWGSRRVRIESTTPSRPWVWGDGLSGATPSSSVMFFNRCQVSSDFTKLSGPRGLRKDGRPPTPPPPVTYHGIDPSPSHSHHTRPLPVDADGRAGGRVGRFLCRPDFGLGDDRPDEFRRPRDCGPREGWGYRSYHVGDGEGPVLRFLRGLSLTVRSLRVRV